jgi:hypothetical protein
MRRIFGEALDDRDLAELTRVMHRISAPDPPQDHAARH